VQVAQIDRVIEAELGTQRGLHLGRHVRIGRELAEWIARRERQHDEQDDRNPEQARDRDHQAAQDVLTHERII